MAPQQTTTAAPHYRLRCLGTEAFLDDDGVALRSNSAEPAFLRAEYSQRQLHVGPPEDGLYRFRDWLPIRRQLSGSAAPVTYQSQGLAQALGLQRLWITFSGYWPERGAGMLTGTFKECEAYAVCARIPESHPETLVVASAGNTARAFIRVCSENRIPLVVVVPEPNLPNIWAVGEVADTVTLVAAGNNADYTRAIELGDLIAHLPGHRPEGGARNVARRDGMGTTVLSAVTTIGEIPEFYFQAVGSGTGAIAAWEANQRLIADGRYGDRQMRLFLSQNKPFVILRDSWKRKSRRLVRVSEDRAKRLVSRIAAKVLANRKPPWDIRGGLFDALTETRGTMLGVSNREAARAAQLFERTEGIDPAPAASVAVASLIRSVRARLVKRNSLVMLNITGGGFNRVRQDYPVRQLSPKFVVSEPDPDPEHLLHLLQEQSA